ncbi:cell division GTPase [Longirhabdus pacifica]|uniref:cell division GTPase n=1 Tax=Longirhabdus pacifica TaxID=2305227 RepID=UPI0010090D70|nr:cell division GTPase [Longirhabdus pacifica]
MTTIEKSWRLESFVMQKEAEASLKYGFIGLGQGGSKIVDAFASIWNPKTNQPQYPTIIINSNIGDISSLHNVPKNNQFVLKGYERGVGKDPSVGKQAFMENGEWLFEEIVRVMKDCEMIYICSSLGGGTGTGIVNALVDIVADYLAIPVGTIVSLPNPDEVESLNAFNSLSEMVPKLNEHRQSEDGNYRLLENCIVLDNQKIIEEHLQNPEMQNLTWDKYSNYKVASILHEWNVLTSLKSELTLDAADIKNHILQTGGILTFMKKKINLDDIRGQDDLIQEIVSIFEGRNVLANGFDYENDVKALGMSILLPRKRNMINQDTLEVVRKKLKEKIKGSIYVGYATWGSEKNALVYTIASMGGLPVRAKQLRNEAEVLLKQRKEREKAAQASLTLGGKIEVEVKTNARKIRGGNPFQQQSPVEEEKIETKENGVFNPFKK